MKQLDNSDMANELLFPDQEHTIWHLMLDTAESTEQIAESTEEGVSDILYQVRMTIRETVHK